MNVGKKMFYEMNTDIVSKTRRTGIVTVDKKNKTCKI